jgi:hypothetical protein
VRRRWLPPLGLYGLRDNAEMLFTRDFVSFTGGHLKFLNYLDHTSASGLATPVLYQTPTSRSVPGNIFRNFGGKTIDKLRPFPAYFIAGDDWFLLDRAGIDTRTSVVINLVQGFRHAAPGSPLLACLARPAVRICVSPAVANAIRNYANGEVYVIENGIKVESISDARHLDGPPRVLIAGLKNPEMAKQIEARLSGLVEVDVIISLLPRQEFLARMAAASICILLPGAKEGFFIPPLEAMALGRAVITPDCEGNLCYCKSEENCLMPEYDAQALAEAALALINSKARLSRIARGGLMTAKSRSLVEERAAYTAILSRCLGAASRNVRIHDQTSSLLDGKAVSSHRSGRPFFGLDRHKAANSVRSR